jgi:hypothetical protein
VLLEFAKGECHPLEQGRIKNVKGRSTLVHTSQDHEMATERVFCTLRILYLAFPAQEGDQIARVQYWHNLWCRDAVGLHIGPL